MKRVGPDLKLPNLKRSDLRVPAALTDLYWDLRDRRLLPLVALLVVAIIAAPILLGRGSSSTGPTQVPTITATGKPSRGARLAVVQAQPGLRSLKQRFAHRKPTDPFKQRFTGAQVAKAEANAVQTTTSGTTASPTTEKGAESPVVTVHEGSTAPSPETPPPSGGNNESTPPPPTSPKPPPSPNEPAERGPGGSGAGGGKSEGGGSHESSPDPEGSGELRYYEWTAKIEILHTERARDGTTKLSEPEARESVKPLTPLPGKKTPVVTFIGVDPETGNSLFVVAKEVTAIFGEGKCVSGTSSCEVVELEKGFPETFEYGPVHQRWKLKVLGTEMVRAPKPADG